MFDQTGSVGFIGGRSLEENELDHLMILSASARAPTLCGPFSASRRHRTLERVLAGGLQRRRRRQQRSDCRSTNRMRDDEVRPNILCQTKKLEDIAFTIADMNTSLRRANKFS